MYEKEVPIVSVVMSVYNTESFLPYAIESILRQSFREFEFIIINDGSTDNSGKILDEYAKMDVRIKVIHQENTGISNALNRAIQNSRGIFLARQDPDDISLPNRLSRQVSYLKNHTNVHVVGSNNFIINRKNRVVACYFRPLSCSDISSIISSYNPICHGSVMMRKDAIIDVGLYDSRFDKAEDLELWLRMLLKGKKIVNLPDFLYCWRIHGTSVAGSALEQQKTLVEYILKLYHLCPKNQVPKVSNCFCSLKSILYLFRYYIFLLSLKKVIQK